MATSVGGRTPRTHIVSVCYHPPCPRPGRFPLPDFGGDTYVRGLVRRCRSCGVRPPYMPSRRPVSFSNGRQYARQASRTGQTSQHADATAYSLVIVPVEAPTGISGKNVAVSIPRQAASVIHSAPGRVTSWFSEVVDLLGVSGYVRLRGRVRFSSGGIHTGRPSDVRRL